MAALKTEYPNYQRTQKPPAGLILDHGKLGDVNFHPVKRDYNEPFMLSVASNREFDIYGNIPLTVMELRQKIIQDATKYNVPVWFDQCIGFNDAGKACFLPFASATSDREDAIAVPVILNAEISRHVEAFDRDTYPVTVAVPTPDGEIAYTVSAIHYRPGCVVDVHSIYPY